MPGRGRSSFTKRQKEHARQQRQRDKAERKSQRKSERQSETVEDMSELTRAAQEQAALLSLEPHTQGGALPDESEKSDN
jgi:ribosome-binding protein aMBF1 (putative translation factor)